MGILAIVMQSKSIALRLNNISPGPLPLKNSGNGPGDEASIRS